ncbi:CU044_5270 family protein [Allostreptomyces psammosilenae]|uniref:CU044_5270 family protein n=1 Tax=Allostreptomyces psammosilenae TaxID=1892865 RepID=A0A853A172_9ACTN|nr:CU044_5270 family protein [Allostreptomyces psammosilenae]NYI04561.1 hypothetical protein [Allostreptomyces psammosilenae]
MAIRHEDIEETFRSLDPALGAGDTDEQRAALLRRVLATPRQAAPARSGFGRVPRPALVAAPLLAAAALVTTLAVPNGGGEEVEVTAQQHREAVELLDRIALAAASGPEIEVRDDQYVYTRTEGERGTPDGADRIERDDWHAVDGARDGWLSERVLSGPSAGTELENLSGVIEADPNATTYRELEALPTDPGVLLESLYAATEGQGPDPHTAVLEDIGSKLAQASLLPDVGAALYRAVAEVPGVVVVDDAVDAAGRRGVGLAFEEPSGERTQWVFDRDTLRYLGSDEIAVLDVAVVDEIGEVPEAPTRSGQPREETPAA